MGISIGLAAAIMAANGTPPGHTVTFGFNDALTDAENIVGTLVANYGPAAYADGVAGQALVGDTVGAYASVFNRFGGELAPGVFDAEGVAFFCKASSGVLDNVWVGCSPSGAPFLVQLTGGGGGIYLTNPGLVAAHMFTQPIGDWAHYAVDFGSTTRPIKIWREGVLVYTAPADGRLWLTDQSLGFNPNVQVPANRTIDSLVYTDIPLTDEIVSYLMTNPT